MKRIVIIACWISVILVGVFLRFDQLAKRPLHADEATGARITAARMESGDYRFDPIHYHGPLLSGLAMPLCRWNGESAWQNLTKKSLRLGPAIAGSLLLLAPLLWRRRFGDLPLLLAAALMATSPLLVYYSRMFIHESLLVFFGMMVLITLIRFPRYGVPGLLLGLMFATKETFAISVIAWMGAAVIIASENRQKLDRQTCLTFWKNYRASICVSLVLAALSSFYFYTDGFRQLQGAIDAVRTYFVYKTVDGHGKPFAYYFQLLAFPMKSGGLWWFGTPIVILALTSFANSFHRDSKSPAVIRFIAYSTLGHFAIYSLISYKTPWLACLPWAHVCLLAGFGVAEFSHHRLPMKAALSLLIGICLVSQFIQTRRAIGRFASDQRNPFAYVPTRNDIETLGPWLEKLRLTAPQISQEPIAVVGSDYWPLPWYLRSFKKIGYWPDAPNDLSSRTIVFAMPQAAETVSASLENTHASLPRSLRAEVPLMMYVRNDIWKLWMESDQ